MCGYTQSTARGARKFRSFLHHHLEPESRCVLSTFEKPEKKQSRFFTYDMKQVLTPHLLWLPSESGATKSPSSNSHRSWIQQSNRTTVNKAAVPKKQSQKLSFHELLQLSSQGLLQRKKTKMPVSLSLHGRGQTAYFTSFYLSIQLLMITHLDIDADDP